VRRIAVIGNLGDTLVRFRGPLIKAMVAAGAEVHAFAPGYTDAERCAVEGMGAVPVDYDLDRAGMNPVRDARAVVALSRELRRRCVDTTFCYFIKPIIYGSIAARLAGVRHRFAMIEGAGYVFSDHQKMSAKRRLLRSGVAGLYKLGLSQVRRVFVLNEDDASLFGEGRIRIVDPTKIVRLEGIGIDLREYPNLPFSRCARDYELTFMMATRLLREKGVREFADAARLVKNRSPSVRFILLGGLDSNPDGLSEGDVQGWVEDGVLEWPGRVSDVRPWLAEADVFVLPSYYREGLPRSILEAMASGRPIITTDWVGCRDTVDHGVNGFLIPIRDPQALADAMLKFVRNPSMAGEMGAESRRLAENRFDVRKINSQILEVMAASAPAWEATA
jgi:glycosyltransferase involved in cell wall biosynthesis